jgi:hypothetical protein
MGRSPAVGEPPTWPPPPRVGFCPPTGPGLWCPLPQPYPGQPFGTPPPQTGQGYWPSPTLWGAPPEWQVPPTFGSPSWRTPLRSTTSTPSTVRQAYAKIGFVCLLDYFAFLTCSFTCLLGRFRITTRQWARI